MRYRSFLAITTIFVLTSSVFADAKPNFLIFVADDMAWNDCAPYGNDKVRTPNITKLAKEGMRFDRAVLTCSSCSPSRCSILTGRYPHSTGAGELHLPLPKTQTMLTVPLREAGYWTAAVGKWHLGDHAIEQVDYQKSAAAPMMGEAWVTALKERPKDKPFFLWAAHSDPHRGYSVGAVDPPHDPAKVIVPPFFPDTPVVRRDIALYYDEVSRFDQHIGETMAELERQGIADNTFVLVISDNGRPFPHCKTRVNVPGVRTPFIVRWPKGVAKRGRSKRVVSTVDIAPTLLELAGLEPLDSFQGKSFTELLSDPRAAFRKHAFAEHNWHDYRAFERGVHSKKYCYVRNWLPDTPATPPADAVKSSTFSEMQRLHAVDKLTSSQRACFETPRGTEFLFNVETDPGCLTDLSGDPSMETVMNQMRAALEQWQEQTGDVFPGEEQLTPDGFDRTTGKRLIKGAHPSFQKS